MAAHLVFGNIKGGHAVLDTSFSSASLDHGTTYTVVDGTKKYMIITSAENAYLAFGTGTGDPNAGANPRYLLTANIPVVFAVTKGLKIRTVVV